MILSIIASLPMILSIIARGTPISSSSTTVSLDNKDLLFSRTAPSNAGQAVTAIQLISYGICAVGWWVVRGRIGPDHVDWMDPGDFGESQPVFLILGSSGHRSTTRCHATVLGTHADEYRVTGDLDGCVTASLDAIFDRQP
jgi:hypothetical protein